jgi:hypothetical protein
MGPVVYVKPDDDVRLYPEIPRDSREYKEIYAQRTSCERSNSAKKAGHKLERISRLKPLILFRLYLISIVEHAKAWLAEDRKVAGKDNIRLLCDPAVISRPISNQAMAKAG